MLVPVAARSKAWVCGRSLARIVGSNPAGAWMSVCCECCVLSDRALCFGLITRPEESCRVWCVWVWLWNLDNEEALAHWGLLRHGKKKRDNVISFKVNWITYNRHVNQWDYRNFMLPTWTQLFRESDYSLQVIIIEWKFSRRNGTFL